MRTLSDWLGYIESQHPKSIDMGLERVREVATRMQLPHPARHVITVAGTNGKGSTVAFIDSIARAAGWRVGAYMSPHLLVYNERVHLEGREASDEDLVAAFQAVDAARCSPPAQIPDIALTYFEFGTLAALWLFARQDLDLVILEVGLGGRLDATNIVDADVAVVTTVDLDHQDFLGNDREAIGFEKAGIARAWKPLVLGEDDPPSSVLRHAYAIGASAVRAGCDYLFEAIDAETWHWREVGFELELPMPRLAAPAQLRNAATAIAALRALDAPVTEAAWREGIAAAHLPARLERFVRDGVDIVVDVGHNPQAARELSRWLRETPITGRTIAVFAALAGKDIEGVVAAVAGQIDAWYLAGLVEAGPRGLSAGALAARLHATDARDGEAFNTVAQAMTAARSKTSPGDRILVFGSFRTAAAALQAMNDP
ncbi:MAG: bifunctional tetrahydrofolate synthase/dihydrofolate synthase [Luteimonas sp.]